MDIVQSLRQSGTMLRMWSCHIRATIATTSRSAARRSPAVSKRGLRALADRSPRRCVREIISSHRRSFCYTVARRLLPHPGVLRGVIGRSGLAPGTHVLRSTASDADVFVPELRMLADEVAHHLDAFLVLKDL